MTSNAMKARPPSVRRNSGSSTPTVIRWVASPPSHPTGPACRSFGLGLQRILGTIDVAGREVHKTKKRRAHRADRRRLPSREDLSVSDARLRSARI